MLTYESPFWPLWLTKDVFLWLEYWDKSFLLHTMTDTVYTPTVNSDLVQENRCQLSVLKTKYQDPFHLMARVEKKPCKGRCPGGDDGSLPSLSLSRGLTMKPWQLLHYSTVIDLTLLSLLKSVEETPGNWPGHEEGGGALLSAHLSKDKQEEHHQCHKVKKMCPPAGHSCACSCTNRQEETPRGWRGALSRILLCNIPKTRGLQYDA